MAWNNLKSLLFENDSENKKIVKKDVEEIKQEDIKQINTDSIIINPNSLKEKGDQLNQDINQFIISNTVIFNKLLEMIKSLSVAIIDENIRITTALESLKVAFINFDVNNLKKEIEKIIEYIQIINDKENKNLEKMKFQKVDYIQTEIKENEKDIEDMKKTIEELNNRISDLQKKNIDLTGQSATNNSLFEQTKMIYETSMKTVQKTWNDFIIKIQERIN